MAASLASMRKRPSANLARIAAARGAQALQKAPSGTRMARVLQPQAPATSPKVAHDLRHRLEHLAGVRLVPHLSLAPASRSKRNDLRGGLMDSWWHWVSSFLSPSWKVAAACTMRFEQRTTS